MKKPSATRSATRTSGQSSSSRKATRSGWTRTAEDIDAGQLFGRKLKELREARNLSLSDATAQTGIPGATLSRIENNKMVPTFPVLLKIMNSFGLEWSDIVSPAIKRSPLIPPSISTESAVSPITVSTGRYVLPHDNAENFPFIPIILEVSATKPEQFGGLVGHNGFEFCYVLDGELTLHMKDRKPIQLQAGQSIMFDSAKPHAYTTGKNGPSRLLIVSTKPVGSSFNAPDSELRKVRDRRLRL